MSKCANDIRLDIIDTIGEKLQGKGAFVQGNSGYFPNPKLATPTIHSINTEFGEIVVKEGEKGAFFIEPSSRLVEEYWNEYNKSKPSVQGSLFFQQNQVNYTLKSINILQSPKAIEVFAKGEKNKWSIDKILSELQIPQQQKELIKASGETTREGVLTSLLANYSYTIQIDVAEDFIKQNAGTGRDTIGFNMATGLWELTNDVIGTIFSSKDKEEVINFYGEDLTAGVPTQYYSNLTVPGGTNYTENEISTPLITPSIKGHAQFATDKGIGWFRSDDRQQFTTSKVVDEGFNSKFTYNGDIYEDIDRGLDALSQTYKNGEEIKASEYEQARISYVKAGIVTPKTRRILEVQSDLFQKGRDKEDLIGKTDNSAGIDTTGFFDEDTQTYDKRTEKGDKQNNFLQLLNKENNWVTFFVKSIIQDSAKRGYEKVLFPTGNTASKVEGHATLEEFKKQKEDRIKELELKKREAEVKLKNLKEKGNTGAEDEDLEPEFYEEMYGKNLKKYNEEISQLKQELERVDREGFGALKPIYNFYENSVKNILRKNYNVKEITDEYGNTWNEVVISKKDVGQTILLQMQNSKQSKASPETVSKIKSLLNKWGVKISTLEDYADETGLNIDGINGVADLVRQIIAVAEGKESEALTEEAIHIATAILAKTNPELVNSMLSKIHKFKIYDEVFAQYSERYKNKDGTTNIRMVKKEAVDKLLAELVINKLENREQYPELKEEKNTSLLQGWWQKILNWFSRAYKKSGISLFGEAADIILNSNIGNVTDISDGGIFFSLNEQENTILNKFQETDKIISKEYVEESSESVLQNSEEANNWYNVLVNGEWKRLQHRVTDEVKKYYARIFKVSLTKEQKERSEIFREYGISGHKAFDNIVLRYVDPTTHKLRDAPLPYPPKSPIIGDDNFVIYGKLEKYFNDLRKQYSPDSLFFGERTIFNPKYKASSAKFADGEAGTIDLLILEPNKDKYKAHIFDWKFMGNTTTDVAPYKQGAYNIQLGKYKNILKQEYGIEQFGNVRAIPIMIETKVVEGAQYISGIGIGSANPKDIQDAKYLPVPIAEERTGTEAIDKIISRLSNSYQQIVKDRVPEELRLERTQRLSQLRLAIRVLQTQQDLNILLQAMQVYENQLSQLIEIVNNVDVSTLSTEDRDKLSEDFLDLAALSSYYSNVVTELKGILVSDTELYDQITITQQKINDRLADFNKTKNEFTEKIGQSKGIFDLLKPEKIIGGLYKMFKSFDEYSNRAARLIVTLYNEATQNAIDKSTEFAKSMAPLIESINKNHRSYRKLIKGGKHELINELSDDLQIEFDKAAKDGKLEAFIKENILDEKEYVKAVEKLRDEKIEKISNRIVSQPWEEEQKEKEIEQIILQYSPFKPAHLNETFRAHLKKDKWYSDEYRELLKSENKDLLEFYNKIIELNKIAYESGYIEYKKQKTFLPFMEKSLLDKMATNGWELFKAPGQFIDALNRSDLAKHSYNEITGQQVFTLPKPFTKNIGKKYDPKTGETTYDASNISQELGKSVLLYAQAMYKYQEMSSIDDQINLILDVEKLKDHIVTDKFGNIQIKEGSEEMGEPEAQTVAGNEKNAEVLYNFVQYLIYGNRYPLSQDVALANPLNAAKKLLNDKVMKPMGWKEFTPSDTPVSMIRLIDAVNRAFQIKTLGGSPAAGAVNWFGANIQALAQKSGYYKIRDFAAAEFKMKRMFQFTEPEANKFHVLLDVFKPLTENFTYDLYKKASTNPLDRWSFQDAAMIFMHKPELQVQYANFEAILKNMIIVDGKFRNITEYVKSKHKNRYDKTLSKQERQDINVRIAEEIEKLRENSVYNIANVNEKGELELKGVEMPSKDEIRKLSILSKTLYKRITGGVSETSVNQAKLDIFTSSMMVFKNWIPKLWYTRFGTLEAKNDPFNQNAFDVGRVRVAMSVPGMIIQKAKNISSIIKGTDRGLELLDEMYIRYAEKYFRNTGEKFEMDKAEFNDMIIQNLQNQMRELAILASLSAAMLSLGFIEPPDDDKEAKAVLAVLKKTTDQFVQELSFFYNPVNFQEILSGGMFPALGLMKNIEDFFTHLQREITGVDIMHPTKSADEVREKAYPIKYTMKLLPFASAWQQYVTIVSPEIAEDFGIKPPSESAHR